MKSRRFKKQASFHVNFRMIAIAGGLIIVLSAVYLTRYVFQIQYDQKILKEDIMFARMETYVNTAKLVLDQELPE